MMAIKLNDSSPHNVDANISTDIIIFLHSLAYFRENSYFCTEKKKKRKAYYGHLY